MESINMGVAFYSNVKASEVEWVWYPYCLLYTSFQEMEQVEKDRIPLYEKFRDHEISQTEYQEKKEEIQVQLQMYENDFEGLMDRLANMKKAYSEENEWIKTFQREELPEKLESQHVKKWVDKIIVSDLRDVHVYLTMQNWNCLLYTS